MILGMNRKKRQAVEQLIDAVSRFIEENYIEIQAPGECTKAIEHIESTVNECCEMYVGSAADQSEIPEAPMAVHAKANRTDSSDLLEMLENLDAGFSETLLQLIDRTGRKDSEIYRKANVDRKLFSKIRNNADYRPSKTTALAFAFALELDIDETRDFIARAGFALSRSSKFDVIVEYFLLNGKYNINELNEVLFAFDQPLVGA